MSRPLRVRSSKVIYQGRVFRLERDRVTEPSGVTAVREVIRHPGSVVVLAFLPDGRIPLVRQFRYPTGRYLWELVAGAMEPGESPVEAARRELLEETGYRARTLTPLFDFYSSPGFLEERMHLVEARGLSASKAQPDADERIRVGRFTSGEIAGKIAQKKICDGKTLVGLLWLFRSAKIRR